jgi:ParB family transcriptional regulator, chromosome partitioning protein
MKVVDIPLQQIHAADWNCNVMNELMRSRLCHSIERFGLVIPLVVRAVGDESYQIIGGAQRLAVLKELGVDPAPCVVVEADDANARLLSQALNHIQGQDDLGLQAQLIQGVLQSVSQEEVLQLLPETAQSLQAMASLGQETMADYLQNWQNAQSARLKHLQFQLTPAQLEIVEEALTQLLPLAKTEPGDSPNARGTALFLLCQTYLKHKGKSV